MAWKIELSVLGRKNLSKLVPQTRQRLSKFLSSRPANVDNPRRPSAALTGSKLGNFWTYRVGDYRVIVDIRDDVMCIPVVRVGNCRDVYLCTQPLPSAVVLQKMIS